MICQTSDFVVFSTALLKLKDCPDTKTRLFKPGPKSDHPESQIVQTTREQNEVRKIKEIKKALLPKNSLSGYINEADHVLVSTFPSYRNGVCQVMGVELAKFLEINSLRCYTNHACKFKGWNLPDCVNI